MCSHPVNRIEIVGIWKIEKDCGHKETEVSSKLQEVNTQIEHLGTCTSDYYRGKSEIIRNIINNILPPNTELKLNEYPKLYDE